MELTELPLLPATVFDGLVTDPDETGGAAVKKVRQELRKEFGLSNEGFLSIGRHGSVKLDPLPLFSCAKTRKYWGSKKTNFHAQAYRDAGLTTLLQSRDYKYVLSVATRQIQDAVKRRASAEDILTTAIRALSVLFVTDALCRSVAERMDAITDKVDDALPEVERRSGELIRFEGDEALFVLHGNARDELRLLPASLFSSTGLSEGAVFMLHEFSWTADATARLVVPAVSLTTETSDEELKSLDQHDTPLPSPV